MQRVGVGRCMSDVRSTVEFPVTGMTCASCVRRVEKALGRVDGVGEVGVNLATERVRVSVDPSTADGEALRAAVEGAGYGVGEIPPVARSEAGRASGAEVALAVEGMTCASCVRRVERALLKVPGVESAAVNLATERAKVVYGPAGGPDAEGLRAAVEGAGYRVGAVEDRSAAAPRETGSGTAEPRELERERELGDLRNRWVVSLLLGALMMAEMYVPFGPGMEVLAPLLLIQATVVQFWAGATFYRTAWAAARHGGTNMSTLVAVGTSAAYGYSAFVTLWPDLSAAWGFPFYLYFEVSAIVVGLVLLGRWLEGRAKRRTGAAIRALMGLQAR